jgi:hypothetical protein
MEVLLWVQLVHLAHKLVLTIARKIQLANGEFSNAHYVVGAAQHPVETRVR